MIDVRTPSIRLWASHLKYISSSSPQRLGLHVSSFNLNFLFFTPVLLIILYLPACDASWTKRQYSELDLLPCRRPQSYAITRVNIPPSISAVGQRLDCEVPKNIVILQITNYDYRYLVKHALSVRAYTQDQINYDPARIVVDSILSEYKGIRFTETDGRKNIGNLKHLVDLDWYRKLPAQNYSGGVDLASLAAGIVSLRRSRKAKENGTAFCLKKSDPFIPSVSDVEFPVLDSNLVALCINSVIKDEVK